MQKKKEIFIINNMMRMIDLILNKSLRYHKFLQHLGKQEILLKQR